MKDDWRVDVASEEQGADIESGTKASVDRSVVASSLSSPPTGPMPRRRPEQPSDAMLFFQLFAEAHGDLFVDLDPASRENRLSHKYADAAALRRARYPDATFDTIECAGRAIGRIVLASRPDALLLIDIALLAGWRGRGIGTRVLADCFEAARAPGRPMRTVVPTANDAARRFFARAGFVVLDETVDGAPMEWRRDGAPSAAALSTR